MAGHVRKHIDGLVQDCSNSSALAVELLHSCTKPSIYSHMGQTHKNIFLMDCLYCFYFEYRYLGQIDSYDVTVLYSYSMVYLYLIWGNHLWMQFSLTDNHIWCENPLIPIFAVTKYNKTIGCVLLWTLLGLSWSQVSAVQLKVRHHKSIMGAWSSNELRWLDLKIEHQGPVSI